MPAISTQKALLLSSRAGEWSVGEAPIPGPGPQEVLVKVMSAALNPIDWKLVDSPFSALCPEYPFISGTDGAGFVEEVGSEVTTLAKGDRIALFRVPFHGLPCGKMCPPHIIEEVITLRKEHTHIVHGRRLLVFSSFLQFSVFQGWFANPYATFQQYCIVPAAITAKIPENISFEQAASIPLGLATVVLALYNHDPNTDKSVRFPPVWDESGKAAFVGKPAFIIGGASSVGQYAIQIAKLAGFSPIITTASPHNESLLRSLGATHVLDRALPGSAILAELPKLTDGKPLEFVYDAISLADTQPLAYKALAPGGALVLVLPEIIPAELKQAGDGKRIVNVFGNVHHPDNRACGELMYARLPEWLEKGIIKPNKVEVLPAGLAGIPEGLARLESFKVSGTKLIARPQETV